MITGSIIVKSLVLAMKWLKDLMNNTQSVARACVQAQSNKRVLTQHLRMEVSVWMLTVLEE